MKKYIIIVFISLQYVCQAQVSTKQTPKQTPEVASEKTCININSVTLAESTEIGNTVAGSLISVFKLRALSPQYNWLTISDVACRNPDSYTIDIKIIEIGRILTLDCSFNNKGTPFNRKWQLRSDSLTVDMDKMFKGVTTIIAERTLSDTQVQIKYVPVRSEGTLSDYQKLIDNTFISLLKKHQQVKLQETFSNADLIFESTCLEQKDSIEHFVLTVVLRDPASKEVLYEALRSFEYLSLLDVMPEVFREAAQFLSSFSEIRPHIMSLKTPEKLISFVEKNQEKMTSNVMIMLAKRALTLNPEYVPAIAKVGEAYLMSSRYLLAQDYLSRAVMIEPHNPSYNFLLAKLYVKTDNHDKAVVLARNVVNMKGANKNIISQAYILLSDINLLRGNYDAAIEDLKLAADENRKDADVLFALGNAYVQRYMSRQRTVADSSDLHNSLLWLTQGERRNKKLNSNTAYVLIYWGERLVAELDKLKSDTLAALNATRNKFTRALATPDITPATEAYACTSLSYLYYWHYGDTKSALSYSERAFNLRPSDEWTYRIYTFLRYKHPKEYPLVKYAAREAVRLDPKNMTSRILLADIYTNTGYIDSAMLQYEAMLTESLDKETLSTYLSASYDKKMYENSKSWLAKFLSKNPDQKNWVNTHLAFIRYREGDAETAISMLSRILDEKPMDLEAREVLDTLVNVRNKQALELITRHLEKNLNTEQPETYYQLSTYYELDTKYDKAFTILNKAISVSDDARKKSIFEIRKSELYCKLAEAAAAAKDDKNRIGYGQDALKSAQQAIALAPENVDAYVFAMLANGEFLHDYAQQLAYSQQALNMRSTIRADSANHLDALFVNGFYSEGLQFGHLLSKRTIDHEDIPTRIREINILFYTAASAVALKKKSEATIILGKFFVLYKRLPPEWKTTWIYYGLTNYLKTHQNEFGDYYNALSLMLQALSANNTAKGLTYVSEAERIIRNME